MDYYHLKLNGLVRNPLRIKGLDLLAAKADFNSYQDLAVYYFDYTEGETEIPCIITSPIFLICKEIRDLFALYDPQMQFKGMQLFSTGEAEKKAPLYFVPNIPIVDCLSKRVRINPNGTVNTIILDRDRMTNKPILRVDNIVQHTIIINEAVAESLLRRNLYGIGLEKVEVIS